jgi:nitroreductase
MEFQRLLEKRYSVRSFSSEPVMGEQVDKILAAAQIAPTAKNAQPQRIKVLTSESDLALVDSVTPARFNSPLVFLICYDKNECYTNPFDNKTISGDVDASIVITYMMLAATELNLGTLWVGRFDPVKTIEVFNLGDDLVPVAFLMVGSPTPDSKPGERHFQRKSIKELLI